ncbi:MAG: aminotransferase class V-fold PLP-dependent enzyme [Treponema sp.]|jgi:cysteine desulfurase|nr:aminotransferase class V-fold PLP-dependent enzyme [Treponema sp.]
MISRIAMVTTRRYFDWAATALPARFPSPRREGPAAAAAGENPAFGNPSSLHAEGRAARAALEEARERCARVLGVKPGEIVFTSGGTEANALVLFSLLRGPRAGGGGAELLYSAGEHPSVRENAAVLKELGVSSAGVSLEKDGRVSEGTLRRALEKNGPPRMAALMGVNNETGAINGVKDLVPVIREKTKDRAPAHIHCDLVQGVGKIPLDLQGWGIDSAAISAHKIGGPRGTGLLWLKKPLRPLIRGGGQEGKIRPGTEDTAGALALARALEERAGAALEAAYQAAADRAAVLMAALRRGSRPAAADGDQGFIPLPPDRTDRDGRFSPWILQAAFRGRHGIIPGEVMVRALDERGFAVSTGSACSAANRARPVLDAMGLDRETARGGIRISQGWSTTMEDIEALARAIGELRALL